MEIHAGGIAEGFEEMQEHLRRHLAYLLAPELGLPHQPRASAKVQTNLAETVVHRHGIAVTLHAPLAAQCLVDALAKGQGGVFDGVMLIHLQIAFHRYLQIHAAMLANLLQHVVEKAQARMDTAPPVAIQVQSNMDVGFLGRAAHLGPALSGKKEFSHTVPIVGSQSADIFQRLVAAQQRLVLLQQDGPATQVLGQLHIRGTVADDKAMGQVIGGFIQVALQHACTGLAGRRIIRRQAAVYADLVESDALPRQGLQHQVMGRPEGLLREGGRAQSVLVGDHHKRKVQLAADKAKVAHHLGIELQLLQRIQLIVHGRLDDQRAVPVDKKYALLHK